MAALLHNLLLIGFSLCLWAVTNPSVTLRQVETEVSQGKGFTLLKAQKENTFYGWNDVSKNKNKIK